ncbi:MULTISPECIES: alpha/beta fold hydrolase [unclassified Streptomyces]|uniref:alpha/beta fold hydrolase n=1 Tax=unclassified Streptomyces TaxID=2593676 RepID=UPI002F918C08
MPIVRLKELDFHYERTGSGPALLFLNGSGVTLDDARPLIARLAEDFEVAAFDQRGIGRTSMPREPYTMAELAHDALAVTDHLGWHRFRLLGVSFGGMVAQELAVTAPRRIERLALLCTSSGGAGGSSYPLHTLSGPGEGQRYRPCTRPDETPLPRGQAVAQDMPGEASLLPLPSPQPEQTAGVAWQLRARAGHDVFDRLSRVTCPTLVASGAQDDIAPAARGAAIADRIPDAVFRVFEGGHLFFLLDPTALPTVTRFLADG